MKTSKLYQILTVILLGLLPLYMYAENEPNNNWQQANLLVKNQVMNGTLNNQDTEDWYKIEITEDCTAEFTFQTDNTLRIHYLTLYNQKDNTVEERNYKYFGYNPPVYRGTMSVNDLAKGTYYLKIDRNNNQGAYTLKYSTKSNHWENDTEPNNKYSEALEMKPDTTYKGHLGYFYKKNAPDRDVEDWYKIEITEDCVADFTFQTDSALEPRLRIKYLTLYNQKEDNTVEERNYKYFGHNPPVYRGTMSVNDLTKGTYYLKINRESHQGAYTLKYSTKSNHWENDTEPNNKYSEALEMKPDTDYKGHLGYFYKRGAPDRDVEDWYKIEITENCVADFTFQTDSALEPRLRIKYLTLYNQKEDTIEERKYKYFGYNPPVYRGTMSVNDLTKGTYYLKINRESHQGAYTLKYSTKSNHWGNDIEPNNKYSEALKMKPDTIYTGHLGYFYKRGAPDRDIEDWYKIEITEDCIADFTFQTDSALEPRLRIKYLTLYNQKEDNTIEERNYKYFGYNPPVYRGTMSVNDLTKGIYYLKINRDRDQGAYTLKYSTKLNHWENDTEPNNKYSEALKMKPDTIYTGHLGYFYKKGAPDRDIEDWYKIEVTQDVKIDFTFQTDSALKPRLRIKYLTLYNQKEDNTIEERNYKYFGYNPPVYRGTMSVKDLTKGTYYLKINRDSHQGAYTLSYKECPYPIPDFIAIQELNTYSFINTTKYGQTYQWDFGDGAQSDLANPTHTYTEPGTYTVKLTANNEKGAKEIIQKVAVRGIQRIESNRGGSGGKVTISIFGGELKPTSQILLKNNTTSIVATNTKLVEEGELQTTFDLENAQHGVYDIVIKESGKEDMQLTNGFTVEMQVKSDIWTDIIGRNRSLIGRWQTYNLIYGNKGNVDSKPQIIWLVTPDDPAETEFKNITLDDIENYPESVRENLSSPNMFNYLKYDSIDGEKMDIRVYGIMVPTVKANSESTIQFRVKSDVNFEVATFITESFVDDDNANKNARMLTSEEYDSYESCVRWTIAKMALDKGLGFLADQLPGASCVTDVVKNSSQLYLDYYEDKASFMNVTFTIATTAWTCAKDFVPVLKGYKMTCEMIDLMIEVKNTYDASEECEKYKKKKKKKKKVRTVSSFDPNEIIGPSGFKEENFINKTVFPYTILFENKASATAPAQEVVVLDTLDATKYDISSFKFNAFGFGSKRYRVVQDSNKFVKNIDLRPNKNAILRVTGKLDTLTNVVRWHFITLDPATMDLTEDPDGGFLPPNTNKPEGEGFVSFVINLKDDIKDGDVIKNNANIFFDLNKPIITNTWVNTIDETLPSSKALSIRKIDEHGSVEIEFTNNDQNGAGVQHIDLYISTEDSAFVHKYTNLPPDKNFVMHLTPGKSYGFYTLATDSLGFVEPKKNKAEVSLMLTAINEMKTNKFVTVYPNPTTDFVNIKLNDEGTLSDDYRIKLSSTDGKVVKQLSVKGIELRQGIKISLENYTKGFYFLQIDNKQTVITEKIIVK